jgi:hypothetical protein
MYFSIGGLFRGNRRRGSLDLLGRGISSQPFDSLSIEDYRNERKKGRRGRIGRIFFGRFGIGWCRCFLGDCIFVGGEVLDLGVDGHLAVLVFQKRDVFVELFFYFEDLVVFD